MAIRVTHILSGDLWGGREVQLELQLTALRNAGVDAQAIVFNEGIVSNRLRKAGIPLYYVDEQRGVRELYKRLKALILQNRPQILVTHGYKETALGGTIAWKNSIPFIVTFHGAVEHYSGLAQLRMRVYQRLEQWLARNKAAGIVTVSNALARQLEFDQLPALRVVHNVTNCERSAPTQKSGTGRNTRDIICVGRLVGVKRIDIALRIIKIFPPGAIRLRIVGEGPEHEALMQLASQLSLSRYVEFLGFRDDVPNLLAQSDALLITSDSEGIPTVLLEAMSCGTPVISRDLPGIREVLDLVPEYPAKLVASAEPAEIAAVIRTMLSQPKGAGDSFRSALRKHFSPDGAARKLAEFYEEIIRGKSADV